MILNRAHLYRVSYGKRDTLPELREYRVREFERAYGRSPVGCIQEVADFIRNRLDLSDFILDVDDPISEPGKRQQLKFGRYASGETSG